MLEKRGLRFYTRMLQSVMLVFVVAVAFGITAPESNAGNQRWCDRNPFSPHCDLGEHEGEGEDIGSWKVLVNFDPPYQTTIYSMELDTSYFIDNGIDLITDVVPHDVCASFGYGDAMMGAIHDEHFHHRSDTDSKQRLAEIWCSGEHTSGDEHEPVNGGHGKGRNK